MKALTTWKRPIYSGRMEPDEMLPPDEHPMARAEGALSSVTDDEYFAVLHEPTVVDERGNPVDHTEGVVDER